ncbi:hypothetical protein D3C76_1045810 [compost metagenome]
MGQGSTFADRAGDVGHSRTDGQVADHGSGNFQCVDQRHGAFAEDGQGAGKSCGLHCAQHVAKNRDVQRQAMPAQAPGSLTQAPAPEGDQQRQRSYQQQAMATQPVTGTYQCPRQPRQRLAAVDENLHYVGHHVTEQKADDDHAGRHQDQRIHQRHLDLLP